MKGRHLLIILMLTMLGSPALFAQSKLNPRHENAKITKISPINQKQSNPYGFDAFVKRLNAMGAKPCLHMRAISPARTDGDVTTIKYNTWFYSEKNNWTVIIKFDTKNEKVTIDGFLDGMAGSPCDEIAGTFKDGTISIPCGGATPNDTTGTVVTSYEDESGNTVKCYLFSGLEDSSEAITSYDTDLILTVAADYSTISSGGHTVGMMSYMADYGGWTSVAQMDGGMTLTKIDEAPAVTDFSSIVTTGNASLLTWDNTSLYPWTLDNGTAISGNKGAIYSSSALKATVNAATDMRLTFDVRLYADTRDSLNFYVDQYKMFQYSSPDEVRVETYSCIIPAGKHVLNWDYVKMMYNANDDVAKIYNLKLEPVDNFTAVSPDKSVSDLTIDGVANYNGYIRTTGKSGSFTIKKNLTENGGLSFDINAEKNGPVKVTVDGVEELNATADTTFYHNFTTTGEHTIVCNFDNKRDTTTAAVSNVYYTKGACQEIHRAYMLKGKSYFDANAAYSAENGQNVAYPVDVYLTSTHKAIFKNLVKNSAYSETFPIVGKFNDGKIVVSTPSDFSNATLYAYDSGTLNDIAQYYYNNRYWLVSGSMNSNEMRYTKDGFQKELVFDVSSDWKTLTSETGFGTWITWSWGFNYGVSEFLKAGTQLVATVDGASLIGQTDALDFKTYANAGRVEKTVNVINNGSVATDYEANISNDENGYFNVAPHTGSIQPQQSVTFSITYYPLKVSSEKANLTISSESSKDVVVALNGVATETPDYSQIVTEGKDLITWSTSEEYPWDVNNGVASNSNKGYFNTVSSLTGKFNVPEGYYARLSGDVAADMELDNDVFSVTFDGVAYESLSSRYDDADFGYVFGAGDHEAIFAAKMSGSDEFQCSDLAKLSNVKLCLYKQGADAAVVYKPNYKFDQPVAYDLGDYIYFHVINKGTNALKVNSIDASAPFKVNAIADIAAGDTLAVPLYMNPCDTGVYHGTITLHTSAGDLPFTVEGKSDYVRYIGEYEAEANLAPVCTYYTMYHDYPIYTQSIYPASAFKGLEGAKITEMTFFSAGFPQVAFGAKDVQWQIMTTTADSISQTSTKPEGFTTVYSGTQLPIDNYELTIPFDQPFTYRGGNFLYSHLMNTYENFTYSFDFRCQQSSATGMPRTKVWESTWEWQTADYAPVMRIRYIPGSPEAIQNTVDENNGKVVKVAHYNAAGVRIGKLDRGIHVVVNTYADGSTRSIKKVVK
jgi:hypothetical protein